MPNEWPPEQQNKNEQKKTLESIAEERENLMDELDVANKLAKKLQEKKQRCLDSKKKERKNKNKENEEKDNDEIKRILKEIKNGEKPTKTKEDEVTETEEEKEIEEKTEEDVKKDSNDFNSKEEKKKNNHDNRIIFKIARGIGHKQKDTFDKLTSAGEKLWKNISSGAKDKMVNAYDGLKNDSVLSRFIGKISISCNQFLIGEKEYSGVELRNEIFELQNSKRKIENEITILKQESLTKRRAKKLENLEIDLFKINEEIGLKEEEVDKIKKSIEGYTQKRDEKINKIIDGYEKKIIPIENKLKDLEKERGLVELFCMGQEVKNEEILDEIVNIRKEIKGVGEKYFVFFGNLRKKLIEKKLKRELESKYRIIGFANDNIKIKREELEGKIDKVKEKLKPLSQTKKDLEKIRNKKSIFLSEEKKEEIPKEEEIKKKEFVIEEKDGPKENLEWILVRLNNLAELMNVNELKIDTDDFVYKTGLYETTKLSVKRFKEMILKYYKTKEIPEDDYKKLIIDLI